MARRFIDMYHEIGVKAGRMGGRMTRAQINKIKEKWQKKCKKGLTKRGKCRR